MTNTSSIDTRLVELLCSRLLHDLISPLSAISNGVELIRDGGMDDDAIDLIEGAARQATRRIQALRLAWGAAGADSGVLPVRTAALAWFEGTRITLDWAESVDAPLLERRGAAKLLLNAVLLAGEALPGQGALNVVRDGDALVVTAMGRNPALKGAGEAWLGAAQPDSAEANDVNAAYAASLARSYGLSLAVSRAADSLSLRLAPA